MESRQEDETREMGEYAEGALEALSSAYGAVQSAGEWEWEGGEWSAAPWPLARPRLHAFLTALPERVRLEEVQQSFQMLLTAVEWRSLARLYGSSRQNAIVKEVLETLQPAFGQMMEAFTFQACQVAIPSIIAPSNYCKSVSEHEAICACENREFPSTLCY